MNTAIQKIRISGFRSLKDVTWEPGMLNIVIGPNGSGKSNLLQVLKMISAGAEGRFAETIDKIGGLNALIWDGQAPSIINDLTLRVEGQMLQYLFEVSCDELFIWCETLVDVSTHYSIERISDQIYISRSHLKDGSLLRQREGKLATVSKTEIPHSELLLSFVKGPSEAHKDVKATQQYLADWFVSDGFTTEGNASVRQPSLTRYIAHIARDGQNLISVLHTLYSGNRDFKQTIDTAMTAAFGADYKEIVFLPAGSQKIELQVRWNSLRREQSASGLSDGTLRFLYLIAILADPNPPPLIAIDEPETGLHPRMLPIIAEYAAEASKKTQIIFTTHSPQFLDAFHDVKPTTTIATWEDGQTKLATLDGDELDYWLREYTLGSLFTSGELENMAANVREKQMQAQA